MNIEKYKYLGNGKYKVTILNEEYTLYEDIILKYEILLKKNITKEELELYLKENKKYDAYYKTLNYIEIKLRTKKEIINYLKKNNFKDEDVLYAVSKLEKENYLNERVYAKSYINDAINLKNVGPLKIKHDLMALGINDNIVDDELELFKEEIQVEKICNFIEKNIRLNTNKSSYILKSKIKLDLVNKGYDTSIITHCLNEYDIDDKAIYQKEYEKIKNKLSKKYSGNELEYKIKESLYKKGFKVN